ncbi:MAG TPA: methyltransferase domain-containing protein [Candidatus Methylomirabilis sp.]
MHTKLLSILCCPACGAALRPGAPAPAEAELSEGKLRCPAGHWYPVTRGIPRLLAQAGGDPEAFARLQDRTRRSFGYQWTAFHDMVEAFREGFLTYIHPLGPEFFPGKLGLDAGCGFGRHVYHAAEFGAEVVGVDFSAAIEAARANTAACKGVHLVQADIYRLPFAEGSFDFAYSLGVLHHLPDPERGFRALVPLVKPGGALFVWVYSTARPVVNAMLETARAVTRRLPLGALHALSLAAAGVDWGGFIGPYRIARRVPGAAALAQRIAPPRIRLYARYPFQVSAADWFDRLAAPRRHYYGPDDLAGWATRANLADVRITPTGKYGWRLYGHRR